MLNEASLNGIYIKNFIIIMKKLKILHAHTSLNNGGIESMIMHLANHMSRDHSVTILSIFTPPQKGSLVSKLNKSIKLITAGKNKSGCSLSIIWKILSILKNGDFEVVHLHGFFYYYLLPVLLLHEKVNFFYTVHSEAFMENSYWDRVIFPIKRFCFRKGWVTAVTISKHSQESFEKCYGFQAPLVYNGIQRPIVKIVDLSSYKTTKNTKLFFFPARISREKNQLLLCRAFNRLLKEGYDICLLLAGEVQDEQLFEQISTYLGDRIYYIGDVNNVPDLLANCDAFCLTSMYEGLPVTLLEALSVGCIPICTRVGGIPEVITDGENGFVVDEIDNVEALYRVLIKFLNLDAIQLNNLKAAAQERFNDFEINKSATEYLDVYKRSLH